MKRRATAPSDPTPRTLREAHETLVRLRPEPGSPLSEWQAFHAMSARVYAEVAEIDRGHHHETLYWAVRERQSAEEIAAQIAGEQPERTVPQD